MLKNTGDPEDLTEVTKMKIIVDALGGTTRPRNPERCEMAEGTGRPISPRYILAGRSGNWKS
jgi:hypothetical protein